MGIGWIVWSAALALIGLLWLVRHIALWDAKRNDTALGSDSYDGPPPEAPKLSVLVAAKDEQDNIEACVRGILAQDYPNFELIAIDDRSRDRTGQILDAIAAEDDRLRVIHVDALREGWFGKNNAMREGVQRATGEWLCFIDADCRQTSTRTLSMAMRHAMENGIEFLSLLPVLETHSAWERIIQPVCGGMMVFWFRPRKVNDPRSKVAYANGAFMLMTRQAYERIGGHERVKTEVNEDMHMARLAKQAQVRLVVVQNRDLYRTRMYARLADIWRGWSRIFYGCFGTLRRLVISAVVMLVMSILPFVSMVVGWAMVAARGWDGAGQWRWIALLATAALLAQQSVIVEYYRLSRADARYAPTYIIGSLFVVGMLVNAMLKVTGRSGTNWRGTLYRAGRVASGAGETER